MTHIDLLNYIINVQNIEKDAVITIDNEYYTVEIPTAMKRNEEIKTSEAYSTESKNGCIMVSNYGDMYSEALQKLYYSEDATPRENKIADEMKREIIDIYGYYLQAAYEFKKIIRDIR